MDEITVNLELASDCLPLTLRWVHPGQFRMSNDFIIGPDPEAPIPPDATGEFEVVLTQGYWLGIFPVTRGQWKAVMGENAPAILSESFSDNAPVDDISWQAAINFCNRLNTRLIPKPEGYIFSLPMEAQWEYACKSGNNYIYQIGNSFDVLSQVAWHYDNASTIQDVGQKLPNYWGFYDMLGNVSEMCFDFAIFYPDGTTHKDWIGNMPGNDYCVARGGSIFNKPAHTVTTSTRGEMETFESSIFVGFRLCLRQKTEADNLIMTTSK